MAQDYLLGLYEKALPQELTWNERLNAAKAAGFDFLEISIDETDQRLARLDWTQQERQDLLDAVAKTGVPIKTMCLSGHRKYPLGSHDPLVRQRGLDIMEKAIQLACDLGIRIIQLAGYDVYYETGDQETRAFFLDNLTKSVQMASAQGVLLGFETMETAFMDTISKAMAYVDRIRSPYLGVYPDLGNLTNAAHLYGLKLKDEFNAGQSHLFSMHIKDTVEGVYRNLQFGEGRVDFASGIALARAQGVGCFVAECWHLGDADWQDTLSRASDFIRGFF
jgi:predicted hexulose-6-phosphate isomerase